MELYRQAEAQREVLKEGGRLKLQKSSKESGSFQSLSSICSFLLKSKSKWGGGEAWHNATPTYASVVRDDN